MVEHDGYKVMTAREIKDVDRALRTGLLEIRGGIERYLIGRLIATAIEVDKVQSGLILSASASKGIQSICNH